MTSVFKVSDKKKIKVRYYCVHSNHLIGQHIFYTVSSISSIQSPNGFSVRLKRWLIQNTVDAKNGKIIAISKINYFWISFPFKIISITLNYQFKLLDANIAAQLPWKCSTIYLIFYSSFFKKSHRVFPRFTLGQSKILFWLLSLRSVQCSSRCF